VLVKVNKKRRKTYRTPAGLTPPVFENNCKFINNDQTTAAVFILPAQRKELLQTRQRESAAMGG